MSIYICRACGNRFEDKKGCPVCGSSSIESFVPARVVLEFSGKRIIFHKDCIVGRLDFKAFCDGYRFVSNPQFQLIKREEGWFMKGIKGVTNPTYLGGKNVGDEEVILKENDEVLIGNTITGKGLRIKISFER